MTTHWKITLRNDERWIYTSRGEWTISYDNKWQWKRNIAQAMVNSINFKRKWTISKNKENKCEINNNAKTKPDKYKSDDNYETLKGHHGNGKPVIWINTSPSSPTTKTTTTTTTTRATTITTISLVYLFLLPFSSSSLLWHIDTQQCI